MGTKKGLSNRRIVAPLLGLFFALVTVIAPAGNECGNSSPCICGLACQGQYDPQSNGFNTIDSCVDGSNPKYEWVQDINVTDLENSTFLVGHMLSLDVRFKCDAGEGDEVSINYNNGSGWRVVKTGSCNINNYVNVKANLTLDSVAGTHAVRGVIAWKGVSSGMICGYDYDKTYSDTDDVSFVVLAGPDTTPPTVLLSTPLSGAEVNSRQVDFNFTVDDIGQVRNCSLFGNFSDSFKWNISLSSIVADGITENTLASNLSDGSYKWNILCYDFSNNSAWASSNSTFAKDSTTPQLSYSPQVPPGGSRLNSSFVVLNVSFYDLHSQSLVLEWNGTNETGAFSSSGGRNWLVNKTDLQGLYSFKVFGFDTFNNSNHTSLRTVLLDNVPPSPFSLLSPANNTVGTNAGSLSPFLIWQKTSDQNFNNYTIQVSDVFSFSYVNFTYVKQGSVDNNNYSVVTNWKDKQTYYWRVKAYDLVGNTYSSHIFAYFTNTSYPSVELISPVPDSSLRNENVTFEFLPSGDGLAGCALFINSSGLFSLNQYNSSPVSDEVNHFFVSLQEGSYLWNIMCNDTVGNEAFAPSNLTLHIDKTPPVLTFILDTPEDMAVLTDRELNLYTQIVESHPGYATLEQNGTNISTVPYDSFFYPSFTVPSDGFFAFKVFANDSAGNSGVSESRTFYVDTSPPSFLAFSVSPSSGIVGALFNITSDIYDFNGINWAYATIILPDTSSIQEALSGSALTWYFEYYPQNIGSYSMSLCARDNYDWDSCESGMVNFSVLNASFTLSNIVYLPVDNDSLDPFVLVRVNATVETTGSVSRVNLYYKEANASVWSIRPMHKKGLNYVGNFTPEKPNSWQFFVWANNSFKQNLSSVTTNISVWNDYTWWVDVSGLEPISSRVGSGDVTLGVVQINNTGDSSLVFNVSRVSGVPSTRTNVSDLVIIPQKTRQGITLLATTPATSGVYELGFKAESLNALARPRQILFNATLVAYNSGPYVLVTIEDYDRTVAQGDNIPLLKVNLRNLGNESCDAANLTWLLPSGWTTRDSLMVELGNLPSGFVGFRNISADVGSDALTGSVPLLVTLRCMNNLVFNDSKTVSVSELNEEEPSPVPAPSPGGSGGSAASGGGLSKPKVNWSMLSSDKFVAQIGFQKNFSVTVVNYDSQPIYNISLELDGYFLKHTAITPARIKVLEPKSNATFVISLNVPGYLNPQTFSLTILVVGKSRFSRVAIEKKLLLEVTSVTDIELMQKINRSTYLVRELKGFGMDTTALEKIIEESQTQLLLNNFNEAGTLLARIQDVYDKSLDFRAEYSELLSKIGKLKSDGISSVETEQLLAMAQKDFLAGNIDSALRLLEKIGLALQVASKTEQAKFVSRFYWFIKKNIFYVLVASLLLVGLSLFAVREAQKIRSKIILSKVIQEEQKLYEMLKRAQQDHFVSHLTSERVYDRTQKILQDKLTRLQFEKVRLLSSLSIRPSLEDTKKNLDGLKEILKELHRKYYIERSLGEKAFRQLTEKCVLKIAQLQEKIDIMTKVVEENEGK